MIDGRPGLLETDRVEVKRRLVEKGPRWHKGEGACGL